MESASRAKFSDRSKPFMLDRNAWHELKMTVHGTDFKAWLDGNLAPEHTLGTEPPATKGTPNPDLSPARTRPAVACCREPRAVVEDRPYQLSRMTS